MIKEQTNLIFKFTCQKFEAEFIINKVDKIVKQIMIKEKIKL